jgi:hypothetical protein
MCYTNCIHLFNILYHILLHTRVMVLRAKRAGRGSRPGCRRHRCINHIYYPEIYTIYLLYGCCLLSFGLEFLFVLYLLLLENLLKDVSRNESDIHFSVYWGLCSPKWFGFILPIFLYSYYSKSI